MKKICGESLGILVDSDKDAVMVAVGVGVVQGNVIADLNSIVDRQVSP